MSIEETKQILLDLRAQCDVGLQKLDDMAARQQIGFEEAAKANRDSLDRAVDKRLIPGVKDIDLFGVNAVDNSEDCQCYDCTMERNAIKLFGNAQSILTPDRLAFIKEWYGENVNLKSHDDDCLCYGCHLTKELKQKEEALSDTRTTSEEGSEEATKETEETPDSDSTRGAEEWEDTELSDLVKALQTYVGGYAKVSVIGHSESGVAFGLESTCDSSKLPSSEELIRFVTWFRSTRAGRGA